MRGRRPNRPRAAGNTLYLSGRFSNDCLLLEWPHKRGTNVAASNGGSGRQGRERTAATRCMSNFSSLFSASFFQVLLAALMASPCQASHSDPAGGMSSPGRPLLTLECTYASQEDRTWSNNSWVRDVASDLNLLTRYVCLALKMIYISKSISRKNNVRRNGNVNFIVDVGDVHHKVDVVSEVVRHDPA